MLTRGEAASRYENLIDILVNQDYYFHTTDGETLSKGEFDYPTLMKNLPKIEYIDTNDDSSYSKIYINPVMRFMIILSVGNLEGPVQFHKISFDLIEFIYDQMRISVAHGYRLALDDVRKNISNLFKEDRSINDIV